jgi:hypothetical protein
MPSSKVLPPASGELDGVDVVTLQDVAQSLLLWTGALVLVAALLVGGGLWLARRRRSVEEV